MAETLAAEAAENRPTRREHDHAVGTWIGHVDSPCRVHGNMRWANKRCRCMLAQGERTPSGRRLLVPKAHS